MGQQKRQHSPQQQPNQTKKSAGQKEPSEALAAIQDKLAKDQPKIGGYLSRMGVKPVESRGAVGDKLKPSIAATSSKVTKTTSASTSASSSAAAMPAAAGIRGSNDKGSKTRKPALVSIADKIPRGSRTKPIVVRLTQSPNPDASSSPSSSPLGSDKTEHDSHQGEPSSFHPSSKAGKSTAHQKQSHAQSDVIVLNSSPPDTSDSSEEEEHHSAANKPLVIRSEPSILSIDSSKPYSLVSDIPSIEVDAIERWVGGVQEAVGMTTEFLKRDLPEHSSNHHRNNPTHNHNHNHNPTQNHNKKPHPSMHPNDNAVTHSKPPKEEVYVVKSTFEEQDSDMSQDYREDTKAAPQNVLSLSSSASASAPLMSDTDRQSRILVLDSQPGDAHVISSQGSPVKATSGRRIFDDGDVSTILGGQPTQDSMGLCSVASFAQEREDVFRQGEGHDGEEHDVAPSGQGHENSRRASLPSGLTASCLQELGLLAKKRSVASYSSPRKRRTSGGSASGGRGGTGEGGWNNGARMDNDSESEYQPRSIDGEILAQRGFFPSSLGFASSTLSSLSHNELGSIDEETPKYQPVEIPYRERLRRTMDIDGVQVNENEDAHGQTGSRESQDFMETTRRGESYEDFHRRILSDAREQVDSPSQPSLTSMPSMDDLSTLPSFPSMPSFFRTGSLENEH
ncbi:hypothetical protein BGZ94_010037 [Podila epigama]|nr:hypothetical protein BGZ94_010037 [Podila epigama]